MTRLDHRPRTHAPQVAVLDVRPDALLLARFTADGDAAAFATLVGRYTPAVRAVCGAWLRSAADIDDAAQATFLVLVRRADSIRDADKLGPWLCRVAGYVARRLKRDLGRSEPLAFDPPARIAPTGSDRADALAAEVDRLPEKYRMAVLMHYSAGLSTAEIAEQLGCPKGTVLTRLDRGRKLLERRLAARGWTAGALVVAAVSRPLSAAWVLATARGALRLRDGQSPLPAGIPSRSVTLTEGVVRAMSTTKLRYLILALMLATGLGGFALGQFGNRDKPPAALPAAKEQPAKAEAKADAKVEEPKAVKPDAKGEEKPAVGRRREAVIKIPVGTFVKDVDAGEYGSGRLTWTFEEDKVFGTIEANVMGIELELKTEAEFSLSGNGTIYGIVTSAEVTHLKVGAVAELGEGIAEYAKFVKLAEPLLNEMLTDLPFSYQFRLSGDKLTILNYRALLAGPNPGGKIGLAMVAPELAAFQALGVAIEGTYTAGDADPKEKPKAKPLIRKPGAKKTSFSLPKIGSGPAPVAPVELLGAGVGGLVGEPGAQLGAAIGVPATPATRIERELNDSFISGPPDPSRLRRFWFNLPPNAVTPERIHGIIGQ